MTGTRAGWLRAGITLAPCFAASLFAQSASAQTGPAVAPREARVTERPSAWTPPRVALRYDLRVDVPITAAGVVGWVVPELLKRTLTGPACRLCERAPDGTSAVNALDVAVRGLRWQSTDAPATTSDVIAFGVAPAAALGLPALLAGLDRSLHEWPVDALLVAEATALAMALNQSVKFIALRERPRFHFGSNEFIAAHTPPGDEILSFFSGHTTFTFALAASAGTVVSMRARRYAPIVWATGLTLATAAGYLRIAADRHFFTDVLTGVLVGGAAGVLIPWLAHRPLAGTDARLSLAPTRDGLALSLAGTL